MAMFLARIVMPRSRSRSLESRICSPTSWRVAEPPALAQHAIDQGRLAVVDVGDDGHVADVGAAHGRERILGDGQSRSGETFQHNSGQRGVKVSGAAGAITLSGALSACDSG